MFFMIFPYFFLFFNVFINIHEYTNCANKRIIIFDQEIKFLCLSFNLVTNLVVHDGKRINKLDNLHV